jgi:hypothetical protein
MKQTQMFVTYVAVSRKAVSPKPLLDMLDRLWFSRKVVNKPLRILILVVPQRGMPNLLGSVVRIISCRAKDLQVVMYVVFPLLSPSQFACDEGKAFVDLVLSVMSVMSLMLSSDVPTCSPAVRSNSALSYIFFTDLSIP